MDYLKNKLLYLPKIILIILLLWALVPINPYGYYTFLRIVSFLIFGYLAYESYQNKKVFWMLLNILFAIMYNPIIKVYLNRDIWAVVNIISVISIIILMVILRNEQKQQ